MKMNEIEITISNGSICLSQPNVESSTGEDFVYITVDQAEIVANEILRLANEKEQI